MARYTIIDFGRELGQMEEERGRRGLQGKIWRIRIADSQSQLHGFGVPEALLNPVGFVAAHSGGEQTPKPGADLGRENLAGFSFRTGFANAAGELALMAGYSVRGVG